MTLVCKEAPAVQLQIVLLLQGRFPYARGIGGLSEGSCKALLAAYRMSKAPGPQHPATRQPASPLTAHTITHNDVGYIHTYIHVRCQSSVCMEYSSNNSRGSVPISSFSGTPPPPAHVLSRSGLSAVDGFPQCLHTERSAEVTGLSVVNSCAGSSCAIVPSSAATLKPSAMFS